MGDLKSVGDPIFGVGIKHPGAVENALQLLRGGGGLCDTIRKGIGASRADKRQAERRDRKRSISPAGGKARAHSRVRT